MGYRGSSWESGIWWLILGTGVSTLLSAFLYGAGSVFTGLTSRIKDILFQYIARRFDISEHTFVNLSNMTTLPRLLEQLGLRTYRYMWLHEANADANDSVQHGYIRIPTKSYFGKFLAFAHISHYIWISHDLDKLYIVGPSVTVNAFIRMSNVAATRAMTPAERADLRRNFGMHDATTDFDTKFIRMERRAFFCLTSFGVIAFLVRNLVEQFSAYPRQCCVAFAVICLSLLGYLVWKCVCTHRLCSRFRKLWYVSDTSTRYRPPVRGDVSVTWAIFRAALVRHRLVNEIMSTWAR